jgi:GxxExxY protein
MAQISADKNCSKMEGDMEKEERDPETFAIIGAAMEVHNQLGHGFLEAVYQEALAREFHARRSSFEREVLLEISYKGLPLTTRYRADFICFNDVVVELKAQSTLTGVDDSQLINYLKATGFQRGLLINFGTASLQQRRLVFGYNSPTLPLRSAISKRT